ncbi:hypothetical protein SOVF_115770 [Spinacia oleracea]|nr:hypothetical protein SOVF_115770 [Spinacia oleracea]
MVVCLGMFLVCSLLMKGMDAAQAVATPEKEKTVAAVDGSRGWSEDITDPSSDESDESVETKFEGDSTSDDTPRTIVMGH